jgi:hypothetical protein
MQTALARWQELHAARANRPMLAWDVAAPISGIVALVAFIVLRGRALNTIPSFNVFVPL